MRIVEPIGLPARIIYSTRGLLSQIRWAGARNRMAGEAGGIHVESDRTPRVNYGYLRPVSNSRLPIGGEIKLIPLKGSFPEQFDRFNLMYLVSSAIPPHAIEIVRRAKERGAKLIWNQNGVAYPGCYGDFYAWFNEPMAALYQLADYIFYQSEFSRKSAARYLGPVNAPGEILLNPVHSALFRPAADSLPESPWRILAAGTSHAFYRTRAVLDTVAELKNRGRSIRLILAGEFRWKNADRQVADHIARLGIGALIERIPPFRQEDAPGIYRQAHVLLHTKFNDPCPTVPIEAMSCGVPVVGSKSGGMPELVPADCGVLCDVPESWKEDLAPSAQAFADAVECVMSRHSEFSSRAREHAVRTFDVVHWLERHRAVFESLLKS